MTGLRQTSEEVFSVLLLVITLPDVPAQKVQMRSLRRDGLQGRSRKALDVIA